MNDDLEEDFLFAGYGTYVDNDPIGDLAVVLGPNVNEDAATANDVGELPSVFHGNLAGAADDVSGDCGGDGGPDRSYRLEAAAQNDYRVVLTSDEGVPLVLHRPAPASQGKSSTCVVTAEEGEGAAAAMTATLDISGEEGERVFYVDALAPTNDAPFTVAVLWLNAPTTTTTTTSTTSTTIAGTTTSTLSTTSTTGVPSTTSPPTTTTTIPAEDDDDDVSDDDSAGDGTASEADDGDGDSSGCGR
ncbi:hypothetical protein KDL45_01080 [bacterium]|nr:hypothetical protein [bacterium]